MSGYAAPPPSPARSAGHMDISQTAKIPFTRLVTVELRKSVDTVASFWLVAAIAILVIIVEGFLLLVALINETSVSFNDFTGIAASVTSLLLPVLGILLVTSEWSQRTAMVTFALEPRRLNVLLAKLAVGFVLTIITVAFALVLGVVCTAICALFAPGDTSWDIAGSDLVGFVLVSSIAMAGGFALATLLLNTPAAIVLFFVYRYAIPVVLFTISALVEWFRDVAPYLNFLEAQGPLADLSLNTGEEWAQLIVASIIWLVAPLVLGMVRILRAEVK